MKWLTDVSGWGIMELQWEKVENYGDNVLNGG